MRVLRASIGMLRLRYDLHSTKLSVGQLDDGCVPLTQLLASFPSAAVNVSSSVPLSMELVLTEFY